MIFVTSDDTGRPKKVFRAAIRSVIVVSLVLVDDDGKILLCFLERIRHSKKGPLLARMIPAKLKVKIYDKYLNIYLNRVVRKYMQ